MTAEIEANWVLKTMAAMAAADQRLDAREVDLIQRVYEDLTGKPVDMAGVFSAVQLYARRNVAEELAAVAGSLNQETKAAIVLSAYRTIAANNHFSSMEREKIDAIASALQLSDAEFEAILAEADAS